MNRKIAVVTGAASGIGEAVVRRLVKIDCVVVMVDISDTQRLSDEITGAGGRVIPRKVDVADAGQVTGLFKELSGNYGRLDYLVNCAGVDRVNTVVGATLEEWDWITGVNLKGVFLMCQAAIAQMAETGGGAIVNVGSNQGYIGASDAAIYCASKGGVHQLTRCMAIDHGKDGIRVNCVAPGAVNTPLLQQELSQHQDPEETLNSMIDIPLRRVGEPDEIAAVVAVLLSDDASYMTGSIVTVDGGEAA